MNRTRTGIPIALAFCSLSGAVLAADLAPAAAPPAQAATAAAPATVAPSAAARATPTSDSSSISTSSSSNAGVRRMFCLNMAMQCFSVQQAVANNTTTGSLRRLDLTAPDIRRIVPEAQLQAPIQDEYEALQETEQVQVEGARPEIYVPGGLMSLPWAVMNPTQAWRIFLPVPPTAAK